MGRRYRAYIRWYFIYTQVPYLIMGMSSETFWGGLEGNRHFITQIKALSHGLGVATRAEACERALQVCGVRRLGMVTPY